MNDVDSLSMTPPLSPAEFLTVEIDPPSPDIQDLDVVPETVVPCFHCLGEVSHKGDNHDARSYWSPKYLERLVRATDKRPLVAMETGPPTLFTYSWSPNVLLTHDLDKLFLLLRQNIGEIQSLAERSRFIFEVDNSVPVKEKREQINEFLQYMEDFLQRKSDLGEDVLESLVCHLHTTLLHIGRIFELPRHILQAPATGSEGKGGVAYHCLHMYLDIYWRMLCLFHTLEDKYPGFRYIRPLCSVPDPDLYTGLYDQMLHLTLWDLILLAHLRYQDKVSGGEYTKTCMFSCTCVRELWLLLLKVTEYRALNHKGETFWINVHHILKAVSDMEKDDTGASMEVEDSRLILNPPEGFTVDDHTSLTMWILHSVTPLYMEKSALSYQGDGNAAQNYHDLQSIMKTFLSSTLMSEAVLRRHLRTCLNISSQWEPNTSLLVTLWDHFYRKLNQNESFSVSSGMMDALGCVDYNMSRMYDRCRRWALGNLDSVDKDSSYQLFLRILALHLGKLYRRGSTHEWKQFKGRIYSKFHPRRVQELTEAGLYNLTCLFVCLALTTDLEDVVSKLCDFYDMLDIGNISFARRSVVWRGAFTLMLVYEERGMDISFLADRMVAAFQGSVSDFKTAGIDVRHSLWKLILIYIEGTQEVVDMSTTLQNSEHKLLCDGIKSLLTIGSENELRSVLSSCGTIISKFRQILSSTLEVLHGSSKHHLQHIEFAGQLWRTVYMFVSDHATTLTPAPEVADIAASLTLLALHLPPRECLGSSDTAVSIFQFFSSADKVNVSVSCRYLGHLLSSVELSDYLHSNLPKHETYIISAWVRCFLHLPTSSQQLVEITRPVVQLEEVRQVFLRANMSIPEDLDTGPVHFLKALEKAHKNIESWQEKMEFQQQIIPYFTDISKCIVASLRSKSDPSPHLYRMVGYIVKYCSKLIYVRQDTILPSIISTLIVPHSLLSPDKPVSPGFLAVIRDTLHLYVQGLSKLSYDRDPFVQRRIKDILTIFMPKFSLTSSSSTSLSASSVVTVHPLVASLSGSFIQQPLTEAVKFRHFMLTLCVENFLVVKNFNLHPGHNLGILYVQDVLQRTTSQEVRARDLPVLLPTCLEHLLLLPEQSHLISPTLGILQTMAEAHSHAPGTVTLSEMSAIVTKFIKTYNRFSIGNVIRVMEKLALLLQEVVISVIQVLSQSVVEIETKRGVGVDQKLRQKYYRLLKMCGDTGEAEIHRLNT